MNPLANAMHEAEQDPIYGRVYRILNTNRLGSWADAIDIYSDIRRRSILEELAALTAAKPTKESRERADVLLNEIRNNLTGVNDVLPKAEAMVKAWVTKASAKTKVNANAFAALLEEEDEE